MVWSIAQSILLKKCFTFHCMYRDYFHDYRLLLTEGGVVTIELIATVDGIVLATQSRLLPIPVENNFW